MTSPECPQESLIEALRDGRLGDRDRASVERHVAACAICRDLAADLDRIGEAVRAPRDPATPLEHQRARQGLLLRASELPAARAPRPHVFFALAAAIVVVAIAAGFLGGRVATSSERPLFARSGGVPRSPSTTARETTIRASDDARFERAKSGGLDVITLTGGGLDVTLPPLATGERLVVRTTDAEIEVHGTAFHVDAELGRVRAVSVAEGAVEVRYAGFLAVIPSGGSWRATSETAAPVAPSAETHPKIVASRSSIAAPARLEKHPVVSPVEEAPRPAPSASASASPTVSPVSRDFAEAMRALGRGDYDGSAARLEAFSADHPNEPRADEADYLRAIALQRGGHAAEARASAKRYLATRPNGAHRIEASRIAGD